MRKRKLFPRLKESSTTMGVRLPDSIFDEIERRAEQSLRTKADVVRQIIIASFRADGTIAVENVKTP